MSAKVKKSEEDDIKLVESKHEKILHLDTDGAVAVRRVDFVKYLESLDSRVGILKIDIKGRRIRSAVGSVSSTGRICWSAWTMSSSKRTRGSQPDFVSRERAQRINLYWH